ncbi:UNVERIFIED_CONTAM: hypothetical protein PYX00_003307 [Menopon gallinae]
MWGSIHLLDHQGNIVRSAKELKGHSVSINKISIDERGDYIASCSDDGIVHISGLYTSDGDHDVTIGRLVKSVAIDPYYHKSNSHKRFITGDERLIIHEKALLYGFKSEFISDAEGYVQNITWSKQFVAWASDIGVRVYDVENKCSLGLMQWTKNPKAMPQNFRCNMSWLNGTTLLIGWVDMVRVCTIRKRQPWEKNEKKNFPDYLVEPIYTFTTDFYISGIAALEEPSQEQKSEINLVLLGFSKELDEDGNSKRPTLQIVQPAGNDYVEVARPDELMLREYKTYKCNDYHLESVPGENRYFIVSPRDVVIASLYDANDKVAWLVEHEMYEAALEAVKESQKFTMLEVGRSYINYLLNKKQFEKAGEMCLKILGKDRKLWEEEVYKFAQITQLKAISPYLPKGDYKLDPHIYEMVLYEYLKTDPPGFLNLVKEWSPTLYHVPAVVNTVLEQVLVSSGDKVILLEALAILYTHEKKYDKALATCLKVRNKDIFNLIRKHKLYSSIHDMVEPLMELDPEQAVSLFLDNYCVPVVVVVEKLQGNKFFLHKYLDALDKKDGKGEISRNYHGMLLELHADFDRDKLLPFLRRSDHYPIQHALNICQERRLFPEMVHLLARMGNTKEALVLMMEQLRDIQQAIDFCKEQDDQELWEDLIERSLDKPDFITYLLQNIGTAIDPSHLVKRIAPGLCIQGLKNSLGKMMKDYRLQVSVQEGYKKILVSDYFNLQSKLINAHKRGIRLDDEQICGACNERTIHRGNSPSNLVIFFCRHVFHEDCLQFVNSCRICDSQSAK